MPSDLGDNKPNAQATTSESQQELSVLQALYGACTTALVAFREADNPIDGDLVADLERMVERTRGEIERLRDHILFGLTNDLPD